VVFKDADLYMATRPAVMDEAGNRVPFGDVRPLAGINTT